MMLAEIIYSMAANKCPRCHQGKVFTYNNPYRFNGMLAMEKTCSHCGEVYEKEPGYFFGAMYVSYALTSGWFIVWFALYNFVLNWTTSFFLIFMAVSILVLSPLSFRWARIIWINFFVRFDKKKAEKAAITTQPSNIN